MFNINIYKLISYAQRKDEDAVMFLLDKFHPLIRKYGRYLNYEDAEDDLKVDFIMLVFKINLKNLRCTTNQYLLAYINKAVKSFFIKRIDNADFNNHVISLSDINKNKEELTKAQPFTAFDEISSKLFVHDMQKVLTQREFKTIYLIFYVGYTVREISCYLQVSVQAVNQTKNRALNKLRNLFKGR